MPTLKEMVHASEAKKEPKEKVDPKKRLNPMGETWEEEYIHNGSCMSLDLSCDRTELISQYNGTCIVCDGIMTPEEYNQMISKKTKKKVKKVKKEKEDQNLFNDDDIEVIEVTEKPEKPEKSKELNNYPLVPIPIKKGQSDIIGLDEAKQRVLNDIHLYNFTLGEIVNDNDYVLIQGRSHLCKSGVRKIQLALNISTEIIDEDIKRIDGVWIAKYRVRAFTLSGRSAEAVGACVQDEKGRDRTYHDTLATAETRASSRAVMNLVGWGAVTSEEINDESEDSGDLF